PHHRGGGEPEHYQLLGESTLRPIINVQPHEQSVYEALVHLLRHRDTLVPQLRRESVLYVRRHHDHIRVARAYESLYRQLLNP
ncbi:MAG: glycosyltransferase family 1 protein, partial [Alloprevotella sp.]